MGIKGTDFHKRAVEKVKLLWHLYLFNQAPEQLEAEFLSLPNHLLMIGTGRHELYKTRDEFILAMGADYIEARDIQFELQDEWYEVQEISDDICVVYGSIWAREKASTGKTFFVDMEGSRFTVVCKDTDHGVELCSVHHSMPYIDQGSDEYYPKSLAYLVNEAVQKNATLEQRMELDHMTELYSRYYMERHVSHRMKQESGCFFILDLDEFKNINDTMGHLAGDRVIQDFAGLLRQISSSTAILGRMGGDEFAVWDTNIRTHEDAETWFHSLQKGCQVLSEHSGVSVSCSGGLAVSAPEIDDFEKLYTKADQALYHAKSLGKARLCLTVPD